jgi:hypothetical protein
MDPSLGHPTADPDALAVVTALRALIRANTDDTHEAYLLWPGDPCRYYGIYSEQVFAEGPLVCFRRSGDMTVTCHYRELRCTVGSAPPAADGARK